MSPSWAPTLAQVAVHILSRTREVGILDDYAGTFTANTTPTATQVTQLIDDACTQVTSRTGLPIVVLAEVQSACRVAAALWAAYWAELACPERDADVKVYDRLRIDAEAATVAAVELNQAAGGGATTEPSISGGLLPASTGPALSRLADTSVFW